ncbi:MAG: transposase [Erysipelotrichaceae bacterium]|nr:transposase [Erysipelotrichaceae bacterium]
MKSYNLEDDFSQEELIKSICDFFGLAQCEILSFSLEKPANSKEDIIQIVLTLKEANTECPHCHSERTVIHAWAERTINYSLHSGRKIDIVLKLRRYRCKDCRKTFMQYNPFSIKQGRIAVEMIVNILKDLQKPSSTFTSVGRRYNLSATTVMNIFDTRVNMTRLPLGEYLCLDENYAFRSDRSKYVCVLVDFLSQDVIDILPNRFKTDLTHYFRDIPMEERAKVKAVGIDMYPVYRDVIKECFPPSTKVVVDRFHLVKEFNSQMDSIRKTNYRRAERIAGELKKEIDKLSHVFIFFELASLP